MGIIGISLRFEDSFDSAVARGIIAYAKKKGKWSLRGSGGGLRPLRFTGRDKCDALITRIESEADADRHAVLDIPVVDIAGAHSRLTIHRVQNDDFATGRRAGEYLKRLGASSFAYCGVQDVHWSRQRLLGFAEAAGVPVDGVPRFERSLAWWHHTESTKGLRAWLRQLPRSTALFCCNDIAGVKAASHCADEGLEIPRRITLLGVDDEDLLCTLCTPSLSSVRLDCASIGYRAAALVDQLLEKRSLSDRFDRAVSPVRVIHIAPREVVERESTSVVLERDPVVALAVRFIRTQANRPIGVADVVAACPVSRRTLETRFKEARGRTVFQEITLQRLDHARRLLGRTDLTMEAIAAECAFPSVQRFHALFRKHYGTTPGQWRRAEGSSTSSGMIATD